MTKNKRYIPSNNGQEDGLLDKYTKKEYYGFDLANLVNEQDAKISEQATYLEFLKDENAHMSQVINENKQLKEENEQLKKELNAFKPVHLFNRYSRAKPIILYKKERNK